MQRQARARVVCNLIFETDAAAAVAAHVNLYPRPWCNYNLELSACSPAGMWVAARLINMQIRFQISAN
jgi:hypothetical protein